MGRVFLPEEVAPVFIGRGNLFSGVNLYSLASLHYNENMRGKRKKILFLAVLAALVFLSVSLPAETVQVATGEWVPYISENLKHNGVVAHIVEKAFAESGIETTFKFMPWNRGLVDTVKRDSDAVAVWGGYSWSETHVGSDPVFSDDLVIWGNEVFSRIDWREPEILRGKRIGLLRGEGAGDYLNELIERGVLEVVEVSWEEQKFLMLFRGRIDIAVCNRSTGYEVIREHLPIDIHGAIVPHPSPHTTI